MIPAHVFRDFVIPHILVANVLDSPDYVGDESWDFVVQQATKSGTTVI